MYSLWAVLVINTLLYLIFSYVVLYPILHLDDELSLEDIRRCVFQVYFSSLECIPAMIRSWWNNNMASKDASILEKWVSFYLKHNSNTRHLYQSDGWFKVIHFSTLPSSFSSFWEMTTGTKLDITRKPITQIWFCKKFLILENFNC